MDAVLADAAREINLTGRSMGQLRTANNRRNRAVRNNIARTLAAAEISTGKTVATTSESKSKRTTS